MTFPVPISVSKGILLENKGKQSAICCMQPENQCSPIHTWIEYTAVGQSPDIMDFHYVYEP